MLCWIIIFILLYVHYIQSQGQLMKISIMLYLVQYSALSHKKINEIKMRYSKICAVPHGQFVPESDHRPQTKLWESESPD